MQYNTFFKIFCGVPSANFPKLSALLHSTVMILSSSITEEILQQPQTADSSSLSVFSHLPVEVVRLIFELSALDSNRTAANLACVSKPVHSWVLPILYETIIVEDIRGFFKIATSISRSPRHLGSLVRNVCIDLSALELSISTPYPRVLDLLLRLCHNIQNLYINDTHTPFSHFIGCHQHLKHLHCGSWDSWLNHDFLSFNSLTHLRVDLAYNSGIHSSWTALLPPSKSLPNLTHLAIATDMRSAISELRLTANFIRRILATRQGIAMLILTVWFCTLPPGESGSLSQIFADVTVSDPGRFCILTMLNSPHDGSSVREWQEEVRRGKRIWDNAATVIRRHHQENGARGVAIGTLQTEVLQKYI